MMILTLLFVLLVGVILGAGACLAVQYYVIRKWFLSQPEEAVPVRLQNASFSLPKVSCADLCHCQTAHCNLSRLAAFLLNLSSESTRGRICFRLIAAESHLLMTSV